LYSFVFLFESIATTSLSSGRSVSDNEVMDALNAIQVWLMLPEADPEIPDPRINLEPDPKEPSTLEPDPKEPEPNCSSIDPEPRLPSSIDPDPKSTLEPDPS